jgi:hypothetical protein
MTYLSAIFQYLHRHLWPSREETLGPLSTLDEQFTQVVSLLDLGVFVPRYRGVGNGCPPHDRAKLLHAFVAKTVYQFPTTVAVLDALRTRPTLRRLCGWEYGGEVPSEATFSRAFAAFAQDELPQRIHERMVRQHAGPRLVGHVSRDSTAIEAPERPARLPPEPESDAPPPPPRRRGRPRKGEEPPPPPSKRLERQLYRSPAENLADLPHQCTVGGKRNSRGYKHTWIGYKLHLDVADGEVPLSAVLTSASLHDSQAAIPLAQMTAPRVTSLYDLMDSAYDAPQIRAYSEQLGHVPIIDPNPRRGEKIPLAPAQAERFKQRSSSERVNSLLKDRYGGRWVRVRGAAKVMAHLMFGVIALTATALFARWC